MSRQNNHHTLVALDDVLGALVEGGPLSSEELAQQLALTRLDARMVLVDAHAHGLVRTNNRGQWEITASGREAVMGTARQPQRRRSAWQARLRPAYLGRPGLPIAVGLIVLAAGGVAVANSGLPSFSARTVVASTPVKARRHARQRTAARRRFRPYYSSVERQRYMRPTTRMGTVRLIRRLPTVRRPYASLHQASLSCRQRSSGAHVTGRRTQRPAAAATLIDERTATTGLGNHAAPARRRSVTATRPSRCGG